MSKGKREAQAGETLEAGRVRARGGGRKALSEIDPTLLEALERLVADDARGDPESPLLWTAKSARHLARALHEQGHEIHFTSVPKYLRALNYSMQANRKTKEGASHPDRDAQFRHINETVKAALAAGEPTVSVDTNKKAADAIDGVTVACPAGQRVVSGGFMTYGGPVWLSKFYDGTSWTAGVDDYDWSVPSDVEVYASCAPAGTAIAASARSGRDAKIARDVAARAEARR